MKFINNQISFLYANDLALHKNTKFRSESKQMNIIFDFHIISNCKI